MSDFDLLSRIFTNGRLGHVATPCTYCGSIPSAVLQPKMRVQPLAHWTPESASTIARLSDPQEEVAFYECPRCEARYSIDWMQNPDSRVPTFHDDGEADSDRHRFIIEIRPLADEGPKSEWED